MLLEADFWFDDEAEAMQEVGTEHSGLICVSVSREESPPIGQEAPPPRRDETLKKMVQDPAPPPIPGKVRWRCHYKAKE